ERERLATALVEAELEPAHVDVAAAEHRPDGADDVRAILVEDDQDGAAHDGVHLVAVEADEPELAVDVDDAGGRVDPAVALDDHADRVGEALRRRLLHLDEVDAALLGLEGRADRVHRALEVVLEVARERRARDRRDAELTRLSGAGHAELGAVARLDQPYSLANLARDVAVMVHA